MKPIRVPPSGVSLGRPTAPKEARMTYSAVHNLSRPRHLGGDAATVYEARVVSTGVRLLDFLLRKRPDAQEEVELVP